MKLLDIYTSMLSLAGLSVTSDGCVSQGKGEKAKPFLLKGKRLVLPTKEHQANPDWSERVAFHPLSENIMRGESEVLEKYRLALSLRINVVISTIIELLLRIGISPQDHSKLTPDQSEFLSKIKQADEKTMQFWHKVLAEFTPTYLSKAFVSLYIKRSGMVGDKRFARVGVVSFPFYNELKEATDDFHGVKIRKKDKEALLGLLDYILPMQDVVGHYNQGSDSQTAPNTDALMRTMRVLCMPLNDLIDRFNKPFGDTVQDLTFDSDWVEAFENVDALLPQIRMIPQQAGNEGALLKSEQIDQAKMASHTPIASMTAQAPHTPAIQQTNEPAITPPAITPPATMPGFGGPGVNFQPTMPVQQPMYQAQNRPPVTQSGKTDFDALMRGQMQQQPQMMPPGFAQPVNTGWGQPVGFAQQPVLQRASPSNPNAGFMMPQQQQMGWGQQPGNWGQPAYGRI